jgi:hypothetical protein
MTLAIGWLHEAGDPPHPTPRGGSMTLAIRWLHDGGETAGTWLHEAGDWQRVPKYGRPACVKRRQRVYPRKSNDSSGVRTSLVFSSFTVSPRRVISAHVRAMAAEPFPGQQHTTRSSA